MCTSPFTGNLPIVGPPPTQDNTTNRKDGHPSMRPMGFLMHEPSDRAVEDSVFSKSLYHSYRLTKHIQIKIQRAIVSSILYVCGTLT